MARSLVWRFPLPRTHTGVLLGNGVMGLMVWGVETLNVTVGRAGFWDHRGGTEFANKTTYQQLRKLVESGDEAAIKKIFAPAEKREAFPNRPQQVGCGRMELKFPRGMKPTEGVLEMDTATLRVTLKNKEGERAEVVVRQAMDAELAWVELPAELRGKVSVKIVPTWEHVEKKLKSVGVSAPEILNWAEGGRAGGGFWQTLPEDDGLAFAWQDRGEVIAMGTSLGETPMAGAKKLALAADIGDARKRAEAWWGAYWKDVPTLKLPDAVLQRIYDYGVYKQAGLTTPSGVAASLQGPWLEEYQLPPWSCDYHFNINIQMIYWPALATGRFEHFGPLWNMILGWLPKLQSNAKGFFGVDGALMLPHAVDDRCCAVGQFWTGTIDHACTAWMAQMAWMHYRYSLDVKVLREVAWPLLVGAFNGYWAMLEEIEEGGKTRLSLPVSVSPEYNGSSMKAWGRDASFQLAALHNVAATLPRAAEVLGMEVDGRWARVKDELPQYSLAPRIESVNVLAMMDESTTVEKWRELQGAARSDGKWTEETRPGPRIALWKGKDLDSSHRHPSHLGGIYPFRTIDPKSERDAEVVKNSLYHWIREGAGAWSGWAIPFVALIQARCDLIEGAIAWLHLWDDIYTNVGYGTLHDADFRGFSVIAQNERTPRPEIMQIDAGMGAVSAVMDLLVQCRGVLGEEIHVLPVIPQRWRELSFENLRAEGGFAIGATVEEGEVKEIRVRSGAGGPLHLVFDLGANWTLNGRPMSGRELKTGTERGEELVLRRV